MIQRARRGAHPDHPYARPPRRRATSTTAGRSCERTRRRYDLILFALPDSLTLVAGQSSLRLESYLFTDAKRWTTRAEHLQPDGVFAMYNYYEPMVIDRLRRHADEVFGHPPCIDERTRSAVRYRRC